MLVIMMISIRSCEISYRLRMTFSPVMVIGDYNIAVEGEKKRGRFLVNGKSGSRSFIMDVGFCDLGFIGVKFA